MAQPRWVSLRRFRSRVPTSRWRPGGCWAWRPASARRACRVDLVGRRWEMSAVEGLLDRASRATVRWSVWWDHQASASAVLVREVAAMAPRGVEVFPTSASPTPVEVPFHAVARLLRAAFGVETDGALPATGCATRFPTPTPRTGCSSMTCWASPTLDAALPHRSGCASSAVDRAGECFLVGPRPDRRCT